MLTKCASRHCNETFKLRGPKRFCSEQCREAYRYDVRRAELGVRKPRRFRRGTPRAQTPEKGHFLPTETVACKGTQDVDQGAFVRAQILAQQDQLNPITFFLPDGSRGQVWLASDKHGNKIIGDDRHWRVNVAAAAREDQSPQRDRGGLQRAPDYSAAAERAAREEEHFADLNKVGRFTARNHAHGLPVGAGREHRSQ